MPQRPVLRTAPGEPWRAAPPTATRVGPALDFCVRLAERELNEADYDALLRLDDPYADSPQAHTLLDLLIKSLPRASPSAVAHQADCALCERSLIPSLTISAQTPRLAPCCKVVVHQGCAADLALAQVDRGCCPICEQSLFAGLRSDAPRSAESANLATAAAAAPATAAAATTTTTMIAPESRPSASAQAMCFSVAGSSIAVGPSAPKRKRETADFARPASRPHSRSESICNDSVEPEDTLASAGAHSAHDMQGIEAASSALQSLVLAGQARLSAAPMPPRRATVAPQFEDRRRQLVKAGHRRLQLSGAIVASNEALTLSLSGYGIK